MPTHANCLPPVSSPRSRHDRSALNLSHRAGTAPEEAFLGWLAAAAKLVAIDDLDLDLFPGKTVALVGESGSGKSTVARCLTRLIDPDDPAQIYVHDRLSCRSALYQMSDIYRHVQMVFQDPNASLNPRMTARQVRGGAAQASPQAVAKRDARIALSRTRHHGGSDGRASRPLPA